MPKPPRRCFYYDDGGRLRDQDIPCPRGGKCWYVHPSDTAWSKALSSEVPARHQHLFEPRPSGSRRRSPSPERSRDSGYRHRSRSRRRRTPSPRRSLSRSPPRGPRVASPKVSFSFKTKSTTPTRGRSPDIHMDRREPPSITPERNGTEPSVLSSNAGLRRPSESTSDRKNSESTISNSNSNSTRKVSESSTTSTIRPEPIPSSSSSSSAGSPTKKAPPPPAPKTAPPPAPPPPAPSQWDARTNALATYHKHKLQYTKLSEQIHAIESILRVQPIPSKRHQPQLDNLRKQLDNEKREMDASMEVLVSSTSWPVGGGVKSEVDEQRLKRDWEDAKDLAERARGVKEGLEKMERLAKEKQEKEKETEKEKDEDNMDVDSESRPLKRKRTADGEQSSATTTAKLSDEQYEELLQKLNDLEFKVGDVENDYDQHKNSLKEELDSLLDPRTRLYQDKSLISDETTGMLDGLKQIHLDYTELDETLRELGTKASEVYISSKTVDQQLADLEAESKQVQAELSQLTQRMQEFEDKRENDHHTINALEAAIQVYKERPPSPPASPFQPEMILPMIEEPVTRAVREVVQEKGNLLRRELETTLQERDEKLYEDVWNRLVVTGRTVQVVMSRLQDHPS